jgi:hypothetical protein
MDRPDPAAEARVLAGARFAARFFMGQSDVHRALERLLEALDEVAVPHAIIGAMALNEYGYRRVTEDVDVLLTREGIAAFKQAFLGRGWVEKFPGSKGVRDTIDGVNIDVLIAGEYPGDGKPKPIAFPDPSVAAVRGERMALLPLDRLMELKLASGMTAPHRLRDLADVLELIRIRQLPEAHADRLHPYVRDKFRELWQAAQSRDAEE